MFVASKEEGDGVTLAPLDLLNKMRILFTFKWKQDGGFFGLSGFCGLYYKTITIVNDDRKWRHNLKHHLQS